MADRKPWTLGAKLALVATPFLLLALVSIALTLWVSWQLEGGAAAVNEAGRLRMQTYRMALSVGAGHREDLPQQVAQFQASLALLRDGDPERPLFVPWDDTVRKRFDQVQVDWQAFQQRWVGQVPAGTGALREDTRAFVAHIDGLVQAIEAHMARWTALLHLAQVGMMALAVVGACVLTFTGYLLVLEPVAALKDAIARIQRGDLAARARPIGTDEFGALADGFNGMAAQVQSMYQNLEARVAEKTAELQDKRERLQALYDVTSLVSQATSLKALTEGFLQRVRPLARADGAALRWSDETNERFLLLASDALHPALREAEHCLHAGECHCGVAPPQAGLRVIPIHDAARAGLRHCDEAGYATVVAIPIRLHERVMGEVDLFYHEQRTVSEAERSLLEALTAHLATAMENLRLDALEKEAAVSQERSFLARELHDSIAQALAFLKIQVQLMRDALAKGDARRAGAVLQEIDAGVRESNADVRELLVHFRTRANAQDIEPALQTTLEKFRQQSGLAADLNIQGHGLPLAPDVQIQVLHIVQEALSNVRKHAGASRVWVDVQQQPHWRVEVRDDGRGFDTAASDRGGTHVGLRIMQERAQRVAGRVEVISTPGRGSSVILELPDVPAGRAADRAPVSPSTA